MEFPKNLISTFVRSRQFSRAAPIHPPTVILYAKSVLKSRDVVQECRAHNIRYYNLYYTIVFVYMRRL